MEAQTAITTHQITLSIADGAVSQFRQEYLNYQKLLQVQPSLIQRYLETNAASLSEALVQGLIQIRFSLPDQVVVSDHGMDMKTTPVPLKSREQVIGELMDRLIRTDPIFRTALRSRLLELEHSTNHALSMSAILLRHAVVLHMVHNMLPSGKTVHYEVEEGKEVQAYLYRMRRCRDRLSLKCIMGVRNGRLMLRPSGVS